MVAMIMADEKTDTPIGATDQGATNNVQNIPEPQVTVPQQPLNAAVGVPGVVAQASVPTPAPEIFVPPVMSMPKVPHDAPMAAPIDPDKVVTQITSMPKIPLGAAMMPPMQEDPLPIAPLAAETPSVVEANPAITIRPMMAPPTSINSAPTESISAMPAPQGSDVSQMLAGIQIPERREFRSAGDIQLPPKNSPHGIPLNTPAPSAVVRMPRPEIPQDTMSTVHTFRADVQGVVKDQNVSLVHAASMESDRKRNGESAIQNPGAQQRVRRTVALVFAIVLFLGLGSAALFGIAYVSQQHNTQVDVPADTSLIFAEQHVVLPIDNAVPANIKQTIAGMRLSSNAPLGAITRIVPLVVEKTADGASQQRLATTQEFLKSLGLHVSDDLYRALGDQFFFGIHTVDKNVPVLVIPVTSYDRAFASLLAWEPQMNPDLAPAFTAVPSSIAGSSGPVPRVFQDTVMRNYDVRALKDDNNYIQLYYSFPTPSILVIAESPYSFSEILSRLQSGRKL
jgi:hypothetical protein